MSALPVSETITTNYDCMPETAAEVGEPLGLLPFQHVGYNERWILKMHGCMKHKDSIVLTRQDYIRHNSSRAALTGIVQALLLTCKMVFLGFSLADDNFHRVIDSIRKSRGSRVGYRETFGVQICLMSSKLQRRLCEEYLDII